MGAFLVTQMIPAFIALGPLYLMMTRAEAGRQPLRPDPRLRRGVHPVLHGDAARVLREHARRARGGRDDRRLLAASARCSGCCVPVMKPGIVAAFIFNFVNCWNELFLSVTLMNSDSNKTDPDGAERLHLQLQHRLGFDVGGGRAHDRADHDAVRLRQPLHRAGADRRRRQGVKEFRGWEAGRSQTCHCRMPISWYAPCRSPVIRRPGRSPCRVPRHLQVDREVVEHRGAAGVDGEAGQERVEALRVRLRDQVTGEDVEDAVEAGGQAELPERLFGVVRRPVRVDEATTRAGR